MSSRNAIELVRVRCSFVIGVVLGVLCCACGKSSAHAAHKNPPRYSLEFAIATEVAQPTRGAPPASEYQGRSYTLESRRGFALQEAHEKADPRGHPGISFEIADSDKGEFKRWTGEHVQRGMAMLIDGRIVTIATISSPLPGSGFMANDAEPWSEEVARDLASGIVPAD